MAVRTFHPPGSCPQHCNAFVHVCPGTDCRHAQSGEPLPTQRSETIAFD